MLALNARYDGKVFVPETPPSQLALPANQRVRIHVEPIPAPPGRADFRDWIGLGLRKPANPRPRFIDDRSLWE